jgi:hypothetical protein
MLKLSVFLVLGCGIAVLAVSKPQVPNQFTASIFAKNYATLNISYDGIWQIERADLHLSGVDYISSVIINEDRGWMESWDDRSSSKCLVGSPGDRYVDVQNLLLNNAIYQGPSYLPNGQICQAWLSESTFWPLPGYYLSCFIGNVPTMITYIPGNNAQNITGYITSFEPSVQSSQFNLPKKCL